MRRAGREMCEWVGLVGGEEEGRRRGGRKTFLPGRMKREVSRRRREKRNLVRTRKPMMVDEVRRMLVGV